MILRTIASFISPPINTDSNNQDTKILKDLPGYCPTSAFHALTPAAGSHTFQSPHSRAEVLFGDSASIPEAITAQPTAASNSPAKFELLSAITDEALNVYFEIRTPDFDTEQVALLDTETLWAADVRPLAFKNSERRARKLSTYFLQGFKYAAGFAALLLVTETILFMCNLWLHNREQKVESQRAAVGQIQEQQALSVKLERVFENQLRPVAMLAMLNNLRPQQSIHFKETSTEENNRVTVEGEANTVNALNNYIDQLKASGQFEVLASPKTSTRSGKTSFTLQLGYLHREPQAPAPTQPKTAETPMPQSQS